MTKFTYGRVHFKNAGIKGLNKRYVFLYYDKITADFECVALESVSNIQLEAINEFAAPAFEALIL